MVILLKYVENTRWKENYRIWSSKIDLRVSNQGGAPYL